MECHSFDCGRAEGTPTSRLFAVVRSRMGHPAPFRLDALAIGNENCEQGGLPAYQRHFPRFYARLKAVYPGLALIANCNDSSLQPFDVVDVHAYPTPAVMLAERDLFDSFLPNQPVFVSEYAALGAGAGNGNLRAAVSEAAFLNSMERNSHVVRMASYAPLLANLHSFAWTPNAIWFNGSASYGTPSYYNDILYSTSFMGTEPGSLFSVNFTLDDPSALSLSVTTGRLTTAESKRLNGSTSVYLLKAAHFGSEALTLKVHLTHLPDQTRFPTLTDCVVLRSALDDPDAENNLDEPLRVSPHAVWVGTGQSTFSVQLSSWSVTTLRVYVNTGEKPKQREESKGVSHGVGPSATAFLKLAEVPA